MDYMQQALALAHRALGRTSPNPAVGAVVVQEGRVVGEGYTRPPGGGHAEVVALQQAGEAARGASLYVTLEPCSHHGRTPPCAEAIIAAGIAEVHLATLDPNPQVYGRGRDALEAAGVATIVGEHETEARQLIEAYAKFVTTGLPFVSIKFAMSLDGKTATESGDSRWVSGELSRQRVHQLRAQSDAIMVGVNTVLRDDPALTARAPSGEALPAVEQPLRVVMDSRARTLPSASLLRQAGHTVIATTDAAPEARRQALAAAGAELMVVSDREGLVDVAAVMQALGRRDVVSLLVEGGGTLTASLLKEGLVDKVLAFVAPVIVGGRSAPTPIAGAGVALMAQALRLERTTVEQIGEDVLISGYVPLEQK